MFCPVSESCCCTRLRVVASSCKTDNYWSYQRHEWWGWGGNKMCTSHPAWLIWVDDDCKHMIGRFCSTKQDWVVENISCLFKIETYCMSNLLLCTLLINCIYNFDFIVYMYTNLWENYWSMNFFCAQTFVLYNVRGAIGSRHETYICFESNASHIPFSFASHISFSFISTCLQLFQSKTWLSGEDSFLVSWFFSYCACFRRIPWVVCLDRSLVVYEHCWRAFARWQEKSS
jgi:hypothetical protein